MTSNQLFDGVVIFVQVVKAGGFSAAAQQMGHSTSYISKEINKLESRLGTRLLNRTTRSIGLTPEGQVYFQQCEQLVNDAEVAMGLVTQDKINPKGRLKISCPVHFGHIQLKPIFSEYLALYPNIQLDLNLSDQRIDVIADGYDLVIRATAQLDESSLICRKIHSFSGKTIVAKSYLNKHGDIYHPRELIHHQCICYANLKTPDRWDYLDKDGSTFNVDVKEKIMCNDGQMMLEMAIAGHGIARLPDFYLSDYHGQELDILFEEFPTKPIDVYAIYPSRRHLSPKVRSFIDLLTQRMA